MRGPRPAYPIELTAEEVKQLHQLVRAHKSPQAQAVRARIILHASEHPESSNQQIAAQVGTSDRQVRKWRKRWVTTHTLADAPRSGAPRRFSRLVCEPKSPPPLVACRVPQERLCPAGVEPKWPSTWPTTQRFRPSRPARWVAGGTADRIRPWRYHAWQHIHDPVAFLERARPVLEAYGQARALLRAGTWLVCLDEKTSIQAREGEQPPRPARPGQPLLHEARYHRRGARHLFAGLSVADGQVYGTCRSRKCFVDFQAFLQQVIIPEALRRKVHTVTFILDNGTTHAPKQLAGWLREQEQACEGRLHFQVHWLPPNASWLDQLEIWWSRLQRKHLQPNHFPSTHALETSLSEYIAYYNQTAKPINWTYTVEKLEQKVGAHL
jgi:transposase